MRAIHHSILQSDPIFAAQIQTKRHRTHPALGRLVRLLDKVDKSVQILILAQYLHGSLQIQQVFQFAFVPQFQTAAVISYPSPCTKCWRQAVCPTSIEGNLAIDIHHGWIILMVCCSRRCRSCSSCPLPQGMLPTIQYRAFLWDAMDDGVDGRISAVVVRRGMMTMMRMMCARNDGENGADLCTPTAVSSDEY